MEPHFSLSTKSSSSHYNKALYGERDQRLNLHQLEKALTDQEFVTTVKEQAEKIACLIEKAFLLEKEGGFQFHPQTHTLAQKMEKQFAKEKVFFGEQEAFKDELAPGFGTAFLVGRRLALTAAHCVCFENTNILNQDVIEQARLVFGFHTIKKNPSDYFFSHHQVYQIKKVIAHQFIRLKNKNSEFIEWTDWALLELTEEPPFTALRVNMTEKIADKIELYMLGHPLGLPLKFVGGGFVLGNTNKDFFECSLDAFGGNSGSFVASKATQRRSGYAL